jgi:hypothetical protein
MLVCPLCEEEQAPAETCRVCGRSLVEAGAAPAPVEPIAGLEPTRLDDVGPAPVDAVPGLEPTRLEPGPDAPPEDASWIERTVADDVGPVVADPVEVERDVRLPAAPRAADTAAVCRYCGEVAGAAEAFCGRCGMRLHRVGPGAPR